MSNSENRNLRSDQDPNLNPKVEKKSFVEELNDRTIVHSLRDFMELYIALAHGQVDKLPDELEVVDNLHYNTLMSIAAQYESCVGLLEKGRLFDVYNMLNALNPLVIQHIYVTSVLDDFGEDQQNIYNQINMWYDLDQKLPELDVMLEKIRSHDTLFELFHILISKEKQQLLDFRDVFDQKELLYFARFNMTTEITENIDMFLDDLEFAFTLQMIQHVAFLISLDESIARGVLSLTDFINPSEVRPVIPELEAQIQGVFRLYTPDVYEYLAKRLNMEVMPRINFDDI